MNAELKDRQVRPRHSIFLIAATSFALTLSSLGISPATANTSGAPPVASESKSSELVVMYKPGVAPIDGRGNPVGESLLDGIDLKITKSLGNNTFSVALEESYDADQIADITKSLEQSPQIELASPDLPISISVQESPEGFYPTSRTTQNLPEAGLWGLDRIDQDLLPLNNEYVYDSTGKGVDAYVVDTGIYDHSDFSGRLKPGFSAINDGRGTSDCTGHGTHVAGILGGTLYGVAKEANLIPVRVLNCQGTGSSSSVIAGINWIIGHHQSGVPAVVNMSLGGDDDPALNAAVIGLLNDGVTVVVASGNGGEDRIGDDACSQTPANTPGTITVNSLDQNDRDSTFSNFGLCTDIYAPGESVLSAGKVSRSSSATLSGTSMASPFVAGAVARILHENPELTRQQVASKLFANAKPYDSGISGDAELMLQTPTVDDATLAANAASENARIAAAEAVRIEAALIEAERVAADKAAADKAAADKAAADKAAADKAAADKAAADKAATSLSVVKKSLKVKALKNRRVSVAVAAPSGSKAIVQRKVGKKWRTVVTTTAVPSMVVKVSKAGTYRVRIEIPTGTITSKSYKVK
jgi:subtilisin family serine protease